jgi:hypothetical protein
VAVSVLPASVGSRFQRRGGKMDAENVEQELESKLFGMATGVSGVWSEGYILPPHVRSLPMKKGRRLSV